MTAKVLLRILGISRAPGSLVRNGLLAALALLGCLIASVTAPASASAARTYNSQLSGFGRPDSVTFDVNGDVFVDDSYHIDKFGPFPSQTPLEPPDTAPVFGTYNSIDELSMGDDFETGQLFAANDNCREVGIFSSEGKVDEVWESINGIRYACDPINLAIDNSPGYSGGRVYMSLASPEDAIEVYDARHRPVEFPAAASYIEGNRLTGTPSGSFGVVEQVAVGPNGELYAIDSGKRVVDEFDSSGTFIRAISGAGTPPGPFSSEGLRGIAVDPINDDVLIADAHVNKNTGGNKQDVEVFDSSGNYLEEVTTDPGQLLNFTSSEDAIAVSATGYLYVVQNYGGEKAAIDIFDPAPAVPSVAYQPVSGATPTSATLNATVELNGGGNITECEVEYGTTASYGESALCTPNPQSSPPGSTFSNTTDVSASIASLNSETTYHYRVVLKNTNGTKYGTDQTYTTGHVLDLDSEGVTNLTEDGATLNGSFFGNTEQTEFYFEWGQTEAYGHTTSATSAGAPGAGIGESVAASISNLAFYSTYHYRVAAKNDSGTSYGQDQQFTTLPGIPTVSDESATNVHADRAELEGEVNPNGGKTTYHFEYVGQPEFERSVWAEAKSAVGPEPGVGMGKAPRYVSSLISGLKAGTVYHYRIVAANQTGTEENVERTFTSFPFEAEIVDNCPNAHVRQQTGAALLLDCRGYELVSAANTDGYDVESDLIPGQSPFGGYPEAESASGEPEVLYGTHDGALGIGDPTNHGVDPYIATRGKEGWTTQYVGIPANDPFAKAPFASTLAEADAGLDTFAFGGPEICSPCFADGSSGYPVHLPNGELVQGMAGSENPGPAAKPAGFIGRRLSADGTHLVFGSKSKFEPDANEGEISIYDRNLNTEETHVVSKTPAGQTMKEEGTEIGELDISKNGSRIVIGHLVSEEGNAEFWHLYMNIGDSGKTIDLTPATTHGVVFDGMSEDGSKVFFSSVDHLTGQDTEHSGADLFEAEVSEAGTATLHLISKGTEEAPGAPGNTPTCDPAANTKYEHWNTTGSEENCGIVAVGGGGGVASGDGMIYFLSPEKLDGSEHGVQNAPNLYVSRSGQPLHFVATLESSANATLPQSTHPFIRSFGSFTKPSGVAVDESTGDTYVLDIGTSVGEPGAFVEKYDASDNLITTFGEGGKLNGSESESGVFTDYGGYGLPSEIAVDNDPSNGDPSHGDLYVPDMVHGVVDKFQPSGEYISDIPIPGYPTGVAVDPTTGDVYVSNFFGGVDIYGPSGEAISEIGETIAAPSGVAVDSAGTKTTVYVVDSSPLGVAFEGLTGMAEAYESSSVSPLEFSPATERVLDENPSYGVAVDPEDHHVYVDEGNQIAEFDSSGNPVVSAIGAGTLSGSSGLGATEGSLAASNQSNGKVTLFGPASRPEDNATDSPVVVDSVSSPGTRNTADFEVTSNGDFTAFPSSLSLTGYDTGNQREIYRYDVQDMELDCASCNSTGEKATSNASLPENGLGLSEDGRVFYNTSEGLVDRDNNGREDAYEWEAEGAGPEAAKCTAKEGCVQLISTGSSPFSSSLLGISANGSDAYFFTRQRLVAQDENGNTVKLYDARQFGGFPYVPESPACKASDECHGPGSQAQAPPTVNSTAATPERPLQRTCKRGFVQKHGKCVRRKKAKHHWKAHRHYRGRKDHRKKPGRHHG